MFYWHWIYVLSPLDSQKIPRTSRISLQIHAWGHVALVNQQILRQQTLKMAQLPCIPQGIPCKDNNAAEDLYQNSFRWKKIIIIIKYGKFKIKQWSNCIMSRPCIEHHENQNTWCQKFNPALLISLQAPNSLL